MRDLADPPGVLRRPARPNHDNGGVGSRSGQGRCAALDQVPSCSVRPPPTPPPLHAANFHNGRVAKRCSPLTPTAGFLCRPATREQRSSHGGPTQDSRYATRMSISGVSMFTPKVSGNKREAHLTPALAANPDRCRGHGREGRQLEAQSAATWPGTTRPPLELTWHDRSSPLGSGYSCSFDSGRSVLVRRAKPRDQCRTRRMAGRCQAGG